MHNNVHGCIEPKVWLCRANWPRRLIRCGLLFLWITAAGNSYVHSQELYPVKGRVIIRSGSPLGVKAKYVMNNSHRAISLNARGEFAVKLEWDNEYLFEFQKTGYITKSVRFSTLVSNESAKKHLQPYLLLVELRPLMKDVDTAYFRNPVGYVRYNAAINDFEPVTDYDLLVKYSQSDAKAGKTTSSLGGKNTHSSQKVKEERDLPSGSDSTLLITPPINMDTPRESPALAYQQLYRFESSYPQGITTDTFRIGRQIIYRYILKEDRKRSVFLEVTHDWGPTFYFINQSPDFYRCISQSSFLNRLYHSR